MRMTEQAQAFMDQIQSRRREPAKAKTLKAYRSYLDNWVIPYLGKMNLRDVENGTLKAFVAQIHPHLAPTTVTAVVGLVKKIVASAVDPNGNQIYPRTWNNEFMDLPVVKSSDLDAPLLPLQTLSEALRTTQSGQDRSLYILLAGSGLRVGEALSLTWANWNRENAVIHVKNTLLPDGTIQNSPKTEAGIRQVDLNQELNKFLIAALPKNDDDERIFPVEMRTAYNHLERAGIGLGFHSFRRFRATHLETQNVPRAYIRYWLGHSRESVTDGYMKVENDLIGRKQWTAQAGLGFNLPL